MKRRFVTTIIAICLSTAGCNKFSDTRASSEKVCASPVTARNLVDILYQHNDPTYSAMIMANAEASMSDPTFEGFDKETGKASCSGSIYMTLNQEFSTMYDLNRNQLITQRINFSVQPIAGSDTDVLYEVKNSSECCRVLQGLILAVALTANEKKRESERLEMEEDKPRL